jgi:hypothetical protein
MSARPAKRETGAKFRNRVTTSGSSMCPPWGRLASTATNPPTRLAQTMQSCRAPRPEDRGHGPQPESVRSKKYIRGLCVDMFTRPHSPARSVLARELQTMHPLVHSSQGSQWSAGSSTRHSMYANTLASERRDPTGARHRLTEGEFQSGEPKPRTRILSGPSSRTSIA